MKNISIIWLIAMFAILQPEIGCKTQRIEEYKPLTMCTFNIAWLGDGKSDDKIKRSDQDYKNIADIIQQTDADIIGLQEIENPDAIENVLKYLQGYSYALGMKGNEQNVGVLYKRSIKLDPVGEYMPLAIQAGRNRPGYVFTAQKGNFDFMVMVVHLKSTSRYDSTEEMKVQSRLTRKEQAQFIGSWIDSVLNNGKEKDVFVIGDFNDFPKRIKDPTLTSLSQSSNYTFLTSELKSCKFTNLYGIDHILATSSASKRFISGSERIISIPSMYPDDIAAKISDHCPVLMQFETQQIDND